MESFDGTVQWTWDPAKNDLNKRKHGISFETAGLVLNDPFVLTWPDPYPNEQRWRTMGMIENMVVIVVHTSPHTDPTSNTEVWRMISARRAKLHERKRYEEGEN